MQVTSQHTFTHVGLRCLFVSVQTNAFIRTVRIVTLGRFKVAVMILRLKTLIDV